MSDQNPTSIGRQRRLGITATILGVFAFGSLLTLLTPPRTTIGFYLFCASPAAAAVSISLGSWELIRVKRGRATARSGEWAWLGIVMSLLTIIIFMTLMIEAYVFVRGMRNHPY
jgi:uncharacterized membrane protein YhaH (DUF805 family)